MTKNPMDFYIGPDKEAGLRRALGISEEAHQRFIKQLNLLRQGVRILPTIPTPSDQVRQVVAELAEIIQKSFAETKSSYAPDNNRPFANIEDEAFEVGLPEEMSWLTKAIKHWTAIRNWCRYPSFRADMDRREKVEGRIVDLIVYLALLYAMIKMDRIKTGNVRYEGEPSEKRPAHPIGR